MRFLLKLLTVTPMAFLLTITREQRKKVGLGYN